MKNYIIKSFLGVYCSKCRTYYRMYKDARGGMYQGRCPRCMGYTSARVDPKTGMKQRFFIAR
jgi:hypothetical protein